MINLSINFFNGSLIYIGIIKMPSFQFILYFSYSVNYNHLGNSILIDHQG